MNKKSPSNKPNIFEQEEIIKKEMQALRVKHEKDLQKKQSELREEIHSLKKELQSLDDQMGNTESSLKGDKGIPVTEPTLDPAVQKGIIRELVTELQQSLT